MSSQSVSVSDDSVEDESQLSQQEEPEEIVVRVPEPVEHDRNEAEDGGGTVEYAVFHQRFVGLQDPRRDTESH